MVFLSYDNGLSAVRERVHSEIQNGRRTLGEMSNHLLLTDGKYIRATLGLSSAENQNGIDERAIAPLAAVELLHLASLIHDDIIDGSDMRRGVPSVRGAFGDRAAVLCGDYLLSVCFSMISDRHELEFFVRSAQGLCRGEILQNRTNELTARKYLKIIKGKTAALFSASARAGAVYSSANPGLMQKCGCYFGMMFQLADDLRDGDNEMETKFIFDLLNKYKQKLILSLPNAGLPMGGQRIVKSLDVFM